MNCRLWVRPVCTLLPCLFLGLLSLPGQAAIRNVPGDHATIQAAINAAGNGDQVVVATGTYHERINFSGKAITVRSANPTNPATVAATIIDGDAGGTVVTFDSDETANSVLWGLTIQNGNGGASAGGIRCDETSPTISGNRIINNIAQVGGGIECFLGPSDSPIITGNTISGNTGFQVGGGICCGRGTPVITGNTISGNICPGNIGASGEGGAIFCQNSASPVISGNLMTQNRVAESGGGLYLEVDTATVSDNIILDNSAETIDGGGIYFEGTALTMTGTVIAGNTAAGNGGGLCHASGSVTIANCTFSGNSAGNNGGGIYGRPTAITNSIIAFSVGGGIYKVGLGTINVTYCDVHGNIIGNYLNMTNPTGSNGNISVNPLFAASSVHDYHLKSRGGRWSSLTETWVLDSVSSPCIDAGDPASAFGNEPAPNGGRVNMGAYGNTAEASKTGQRPPTAPTTVSISPDNPKTADDLTGGASGSTDPDGDTVTYQYQWAVKPSGGDWGAWLTEYGSVLPAGATAQDALFKVRARATDLPATAPPGGGQAISPRAGNWFEERCSAWVESAAVRILNSAPTPPETVQARRPGARSGEALTGYATGGADADGETVEYRFQWCCSTDAGATWEGWDYSGTVLSETTVKGEVWKTRARSWANGVTSAWVESAPLTVADSPPSPPTAVTITPTSPTTNHELRAVASGATDPDGDDISYIYEWNVSADGGVTWNNWPYSGRIIASFLTSPGELWKAQARARSGVPALRSDWVQSAPVTIAPGGGALVGALTAIAATSPGGLTHITVNLAAAADVQVRILNLAGREVAVLPEQSLEAGTQTLLWNGRSASGTTAPAGQYLVSIEARREGGGQSRALAPLRK